MRLAELDEARFQVDAPPALKPGRSAVLHDSPLEQGWEEEMNTMNRRLIYIPSSWPAPEAPQRQGIKEVELLVGRPVHTQIQS
jgi:hypothetical protein